MTGNWENTLIRFPMWEKLQVGTKAVSEELKRSQTTESVNVGFVYVGVTQDVRICVFRLKTSAGLTRVAPWLCGMEMLFVYFSRP